MIQAETKNFDAATDALLADDLDGAGQTLGRVVDGDPEGACVMLSRVLEYLAGVGRLPVDSTLRTIDALWTDLGADADLEAIEANIRARRAKLKPGEGGYFSSQFPTM